MAFRCLLVGPGIPGNSELRSISDDLSHDEMRRVHTEALTAQCHNVTIKTDMSGSLSIKRNGCFIPRIRESGLKHLNNIGCFSKNQRHMIHSVKMHHSDSGRPNDRRVVSPHIPCIQGDPETTGHWVV